MCAGLGTFSLLQDVCMQNRYYISDILEVLSTLGLLEIRVLVSVFISFK